MADNSAVLAAVRRRDARVKKQRATETIQAMIEAGELVTFPAVARRAGVSTSLLYAHPELSAAVAAARDRQRQAGAQRSWHLPASSLVTDHSLRADLANAKEQARQLSQEVDLLRARLARDLGARADLARSGNHGLLLDQSEQRCTELEADNARLRKQVAVLEAETTELAETLDAARAMNRELMGAVNRSPRS
jgi:chromosome segregation ATPase